MIISHKHKFIFIKTRKTAGTSIEIALSKICGEDDIITPISPEDELIREKWGGRTAQNYINGGKAQSLLKKLRGEKIGYYNHIAAAQVKRLVGQKIFDSYYKFTIVRNPFEVVISQYYYKLARDKIPKYFSIDDYLNSQYANLESNWQLFTENDVIIVDDFIRYESLLKNFNLVLKKLGIQEVQEIPRAKTASRSDKRSYYEILSEGAINKIRTTCEKEIEHFGYNVHE